MTDWQKRHLRLDDCDARIVELANAAQQFAKWFATDDKLFAKNLLVISGDSGTGKTHTAKSLYRWARNHSGRLGASIEWFAWPEACSAILDDNFTGCIRDMIEADFLALDDIGAETDRYKTGALTDKLCQVLSRREKKWTVITTNIPPSEWANRFDVRVADRLLRNSTVCDLAGVQSYSVRKLCDAISFQNK